MSPKPISCLLHSAAFLVVARVLMTIPFLASGLAKLFDFQEAMAEMTFFGLAPAGPYAVAVIAVQLAASALVIGGRHVWLGVGALAVFTLLTIPVAHPFWTMTGEEAFIQRLWVLEHLSVIGGLMAIAVLCDRKELSGSPAPSAR